MTMSEAEELGFEFTGITCNRWRDQTRWEESIKVAKEIKKNFRGADYRIVTGRKNDWLGSSDSKALMANEIFSKIWPEYSHKEYSTRLARLPERRRKIEEEYQAKLAELAREESEYSQMLATVNSYKK